MLAEDEGDLAEVVMAIGDKIISNHPLSTIKNPIDLPAATML